VLLYTNCVQFSCILWVFEQFAFHYLKRCLVCSLATRTLFLKLQWNDKRRIIGQIRMHMDKRGKAEASRRAAQGYNLVALANFGQAFNHINLNNSIRFVAILHLCPATCQTCLFFCRWCVVETRSDFTSLAVGSQDQTIGSARLATLDLWANQISSLPLPRLALLQISTILYLSQAERP
jgi:hypothetical protein